MLHHAIQRVEFNSNAPFSVIERASSPGMLTNDEKDFLPPTLYPPWNEAGTVYATLSPPVCRKRCNILLIMQLHEPMDRFIGPVSRKEDCTTSWRAIGTARAITSVGGDYLVRRLGPQGRK